jgi:hypothetical protein
MKRMFRKLAIPLTILFSGRKNKSNIAHVETPLQPVHRSKKKKDKGNKAPTKGLQAHKIRLGTAY